MKISTQLTKAIILCLSMLFLLAPLTGAGAAPKPRPPSVEKNIITVAMNNGNFTDPAAAVNSITDASAANPYLVTICPGVYTITQTLVMKPYVDIAGSGENITKITGAISTANEGPSNAIISGANNSALSSLTVENTGGSDYSIAVYNNSASPTLSNVTATASGGTYSFGVFNNASSPIMTNVTATASAEITGYGVYNDNSSTTMTNVNATGSGGTFSIGVCNFSSPDATMTNVIATGLGGTTSYGVYSFHRSTIRRSTMEGGTNGLYTVSGTTLVSQSTIIGTAAVGNSEVINKCVACDDGNGNALGTNCLAP